MVALGVLTLEVAVVYYLTRRFRYRLAVLTWWLALYAELFSLLWVPPLKWPLLVNFSIYKGEGFWYLLLLVLSPGQTLQQFQRGNFPELLLLLLLPLVPALVALGFDYRRNRRQQPKADNIQKAHFQGSQEVGREAGGSESQKELPF
ncbi:MAG: hypothetical protein ACRYGH_12055 [Janthinobacterium lividum]